MSIPLDRLYHFIENITKEINDNIIIYRFYPHGSKNIENLEELNSRATWEKKASSVSIYCHDQEPLNYKLYQNIEYNHPFANILKSLSMQVDFNLTRHVTIYYQSCLLHSEKRSNNLTTYQHNRYVGVYYWSHALIALDWFRFAEHVQQKKQIKKLFLIYNRAWSGTREYRLKFTELLITAGLEKKCQMSITPTDPDTGIHYTQHKFENPNWQPTHVLENCFLSTTVPSHYSADFNINDYESTEIEIVLETLFDDERLHLTEKSLRPIACGQPFILVATHGSLEYLRSYGFKTFDSIWDESYDLIEDPEKRLVAITDLMKTISLWTPEKRVASLTKAQVITEYNRTHFFSKNFFNQVVTELKNNLSIGINQLITNNDIPLFIERWKKLLTYEEIQTHLKLESNSMFPTITQVNTVLQIAKNLQNKN